MDLIVDYFQFIWSLIKKIEPLEIIISLVTMAFAGYTSVKLYMQNRQLRDLAKVFPQIDSLQDKIKYYEHT